MSEGSSDLVLRAAVVEDVPVVLGFIRELAEYEKLADEVVATEALLARWLFGERPAAEVVLAELGGEPVGFGEASSCDSRTIRSVRRAAAYLRG